MLLYIYKGNIKIIFELIKIILNFVFNNNNKHLFNEISYILSFYFSLLQFTNSILNKLIIF